MKSPVTSLMFGCTASTRGGGVKPSKPLPDPSIWVFDHAVFVCGWVSAV